MKIRSLIAVLVVGAAALGLWGCTVSEVTHTKDGKDVTGKSLDLDDVDACKAVGAQSLGKLNLNPDFAVERTDPTRPGCTWQGRNATAGENAELNVWAMESGAGGDSPEYFDVGGAQVGIWHMAGDAGRYVVNCGEIDIAVNYVQNHGPLEAQQALDAVIADVVAAYGCATP